MRLSFSGVSFFVFSLFSLSFVRVVFFPAVNTSFVVKRVNADLFFVLLLVLLWMWYYQWRLKF